MAVAVIADSHLGGPGGSPEVFLEQLQQVRDRGCQRLILLGDIFHVWVGFPGFETPEVQAVAPVLRELRSAGVEIDYVEGNRDFFIAEGPYSDLFDRVSSEVSFEAGGLRVLAVHGDGLNDRDRRYRFWRFLSKSRITRFLMRRLPSVLARRLVTTTDQRLARTNFKHKNRFPEAVIRTNRALVRISSMLRQPENPSIVSP